MTPGCVIVVAVKEVKRQSDFIERSQYLNWLQQNYIDAATCYNAKLKLATMINKDHQHVFNIKYRLNQK